MAAYFHHPHAAASEGGLHTLVLMNQNLHSVNNDGYSDSSHAPPPSQNTFLLNSAANLSHAPPLLHHHHHHHNNSNITLYGYPQQEAREVTRQLHLSLSSDIAPTYNNQISPDSASAGGRSLILGSKFLKAAQELLEEVVHVGNNHQHKHHHLGPKSSDSPRIKAAGGDSSSDGNKRVGRTQLSTSERQEIQMKKAKLVSMLEEAEQRYRQYKHQMQTVITSFEQIAGIGSAKTYTELALKTISKQFKCLKDAIQAQIQSANRNLGEEEEGSGMMKIQGSRLKYIDNEIRQQKALQQLGFIQNHNAWRPQRGLPERSVSVLRAWLFEHFLHPYPKDSDKIMLAKQTGLTRSQVSNWFINARVRLWKPMIEEMYGEEMKEHEQQNTRNNNNNEDDENGNNKQDPNNSPRDHENLENRSIANKKNTNDRNYPHSSAPPLLSVNSTNAPPALFQHGFSVLEMEGISQGSPKRQRNDEILVKFGNENKENGENSYPVISGGMNFIGGEWFGTEEFPRFLSGNGNGNGISLSLGLPPCENSAYHHQHMDLGAPNNSFLGPNQSVDFRRANDFSSITAPPPHASAVGFECIDNIQNRKNFAAQLLEGNQDVSTYC